MNRDLKRSVPSEETLGKSVLLFISTDDPDGVPAHAKELLHLIQKKGYLVKLVNKQGFDLDDLRLVAEYRVMGTPSTLFLDAGNIVARIGRLPSDAEEVRRIFKWAHSAP